jgi:CRP-like cAMP-binding protein
MRACESVSSPDLTGAGSTGAAVPFRGPRFEKKRIAIALSPLFADASKATLDALAERAVLRTYGSGEQVYRRAQAAQHLVLLVEGCVKLTNVSECGAELLIDLLRRHDVFGEIALIEGSEYTSDAITTRRSEVLLLPRSDVARLVRADAETSARFMALLCTRVQRATTLLEQTLFLPLGARLLSRIKQFSSGNTVETDGGTRIEHGLSQQELAESIGACRESVNRQLADWQERGLATISRGVIVLHGSGPLERYASS